MENLFIDGFLLWLLIGVLLGLGVGFFTGRLKSNDQIDIPYPELLANNKVLEEKLSSQRTQYESQIAVLNDAKTILTKEFENLANRIFDDKQEKFSVQSKEALETSLNPLRRDIGDFKKQVESAYDKENSDRNKLVGQISELQKQTRQISSDALNLANALKGDNKVQGNWGEFILEKLLED